MFNLTEKFSQVELFLFNLTVICCFRGAAIGPPLQEDEFVKDMLTRRHIARVTPQLYDVTGAVIGPLITVGKIIYSHVADICPRLDLEEPLVTANQEAADLEEKFLAML